MRYPHVDYNRFFKLVERIGRQLNERKNRFDKSDIFEQAVEEYSDGRLEWVDRVGYDHIAKFSGDKSEQKTQQYALYTKTGKLKERTASIRLLNVLGDEANCGYEPKYDVLQIIDTGSPESFSVALVTPEVVSRYVVKTKDAFTVQIPIHELFFLYRPDDFKSKNDSVTIDYLTKKRELQKKLIASV